MKSHVSDPIELAICIYKDATAKCVALRPDDRDLMTLRSRAEHEGLSFLTITLPDLGKEFERSLDLGQIEPTFFRAFRKNGKIPAFLQGFFAQVFSKANGKILPEADVSAIEGIRQIAFAFKKLEVECSHQRVSLALQQFRDCETDLKEAYATNRTNDRSAFVTLCRCLWHDFALDPRLGSCNFVPRHGPGATAERIQGNAKYIIRRWHERLEPYFPLFHNAFSNENAYGSEEFEQVTLVSEDQEQPVRVTPVPKTLKGPRIIAIEPVCMQYTQQSISRALVNALESNFLTRGHLNFRSQTVNQKLAMTSSATMKYATLDLSSASDRVPNVLASYMFESNPDLQGAIEACRSKRAQMPDGSVMDLLKFASMGSALCFPVESMYFYTICIGALLERRNLPVTFWNAYKVSRDVYVYGDDIIVPVDDATTVVDHLQKYHCKVNVSKSFWTGKFRESCGTDAYNGEDVTPTYVRCMRPHNRRESSGLISWCKTSNQFYRRGYWLTAQHMSKCVESVLGRLPITGPDAACLGKVSFQRLVSSERWNKVYQRNEVLGWCAVPIYRADKLDGHSALTKCLLRLEGGGKSSAPIDPKHLERTARYGAVALKRRWTLPY